MIGHIKINHIRNTFETLSNSIKSNLDINTNILMLSETKLDSAFPTNQFAIEGYLSPVRLIETLEEEEFCYTYGRIFQLDF